MQQPSKTGSMGFVRRLQAFLCQKPKDQKITKKAQTCVDVTSKPPKRTLLQTLLGSNRGASPKREDLYTSILQESKMEKIGGKEQRTQQVSESEEALEKIQNKIQTIIERLMRTYARNYERSRSSRSMNSEGSMSMNTPHTGAQGVLEKSMYMNTPHTTQGSLGRSMNVNTHTGVQDSLDRSPSSWENKIQSAIEKLQSSDFSRTSQSFRSV